MADFHFLRPMWFFGLLAIPLIIWLIRKLSHQYSGWQQVIPLHLQKVLMSQSQTRKQASSLVPCIIFVLTITALAGPTYQKLPQPVFNVERGSVLVMDMSFSMYSTDIAPNRLTRSRFKAIDILDNINEGDIGLVAYAGASFVISPLTQDINNIKLLLPSLTPEIMPEVGSDPFPALLTANDMLVNAGHLKGDIYWLTDDADRLDVEAIQEFIKDYPHRLNILGVGTSDGAPITLPNGELLKDDTGQIVIPKLPVARLKGLAQQSGGKYQTISHNSTDIEALTTYQLASQSKELEEEQTKLGDSWQELGPYVVFAILPFVLSYFRRGVILSIAPLLMVLHSPTPAIAQSFDNEQSKTVSEQAPSELKQTWQNLWQTHDQQAQRKYNDKQFSAAAEQFRNPLWQSSAHYRAGNYEAAIEALSGLESANAHYNRGNALAKLGMLNEAIEAYEQALKNQPDFDHARENKALIEKLRDQQQEQQEQQNDQQQQDDQSEEQQDQDQQGQQDGQNQDQKQNGEQNQSDQQQNEDQQQDASEQEDQNNEQNSQQQEQQNAEKEQEEQNQKQQQNAEQEQQQAQNMTQANAQQDEQKQKELEQKHMQLLNKVTDDPHLLLRNKMQLEYQKRRHQNSGAKKKW